jgi:hypothetical protein
MNFFKTLIFDKQKIEKYENLSVFLDVSNNTLLL